MESGKIRISRENPRPLSFTSSNKAMPNELGQKPPPSMLDRYRALLKQREEELGAASEAEVPLPSREEVVQLYEVLLAELTFNSKPIITDLTIIAGELRDHGEGIANAICARIIEVPVDQKLPSLYLLDSIVKNIGREYVSYFSSRLPEVFCKAYKQVQSNLHPAMRHLFGTWSTVFPLPVLRKIETQLQFSTSVNQQSSLKASDSPRPTHGIHVNPKYLRQLDHSATDSNLQHVRATSSNLKAYGQNLSIGYDDFDSDHSEGTSSQVGGQRFNSARGLGRTSFPIGADGSPRRFVDGVPPSNSIFDYGLGRMMGRDNEKSEWRRKQYSDNNHNRFESPAAYNLSNGHNHQGPRALIDAYGSDSGKRISNNKPLQVERLDINGIGNNVAAKSWQNTEEEEFDWEDMSPTLADRGRSSDFFPSSGPSFGSVGARPGFGKVNASPLESDMQRKSSQAQLSQLDDTSIIAEDAVSLVDSVHGSIGKVSGVQTERSQVLGSRYPQESWKMPHHFSQLPRPVNARGRGKNLRMPIPPTVVSSTGSEKMAGPVDRLLEADAQFARPPAIASRMVSSTLDSAAVGARSITAPSSTGAWPAVNLHKSHQLPMTSIYELQKQAGSRFDSTNPSNIVLNQGHNKSLYMPEQPVDSFGTKELGLTKLLQFPNLAALNQPNQLQINSLQSQFLSSQEARENFLPSAALPVPPQIRAPTVNHGYTPQGPNTALSMVPSTAVPALQSLPIHNIPNNSSHFGGGALPPLPPGPPPSQMLAVSRSASGAVSNQPPGSAFSGLISSLMAQGLISLTKQPCIQDPMGLDFNPDLLKVRHESAINALYTDLPRQCTTCGLRFKCQEEHSSHMDWHVTKNRMSKSRKQKPSRKWFVSASMWLSGAEALGVEAVPGFLPAETVVEKKDEELAVPADEDQSVCALCGEPFDDFYSDETEEWMYKGAVYMNAPDGSTADMDRSQLGPIVHAKCRSESNVVPSEDFGHNKGGNTDEGSQRKRMRS